VILAGRMSRTPRKPSVPRLKVGAVVGLPDDLGCVREALVIEDRGDVGPNGEQSVWLSYHIEDADGDFDGDFRTLALVSELTDPPTESWADQFWAWSSSPTGPRCGGSAGRPGGPPPPELTALAGRRLPTMRGAPSRFPAVRDGYDRLR
jgi:hypothetical protein